MIKTSSFCAGLLLLLAAGSMSRAGAQSATDTAASAPDKSDYTLFDPAPDDQMRSFCTDRPPKANLPCTVDAGHLQYESDLLNWTGSQTGGVTTNTWLEMTGNGGVPAHADPARAVISKAQRSGALNRNEWPDVTRLDRRRLWQKTRSDRITLVPIVRTL